MGRFGSSLLLLAALAAAAFPARAADIRILVPDLPPMFFADGTGREAAIIAEALAACGDRPVLTPVPFGRHWQDFTEGRGADAVSTVPPGVAIPGARSVPYIRYQNGAAVMRSSGLNVRSLEDLAFRRVITFAGAEQVLPGLAEAAPRLAELRERADPLVHSTMLFAGRVDAILADQLIVAEHNRLLAARRLAGERLSFDPSQEVVFTPIFPPTPYSMVFRDPAVRDRFDRCVADLQARGRIAEINRKAIEPYRAAVGDRYPVE